MSRFSPPMILLLGGSMTIGVAAQAVIVVIALRRVGYSFRPSLEWKGLGFRAVGRTALWVIVSLVLSQAALVIQTRVVTSIQGDLAGKLIFDSASLLFMTPHGLITVSSATVLFTSLSQAASRGDDALVAAHISSGVRIAGGAMIVVAVFGLVFLSVVVSVLFVGSEPQVRAAIADLARILFLGLPGYAVMFLAQRVFFASHDARTACLLQLISSGITMASALGALQFEPTVRLYAVAAGQSLGLTVAGVAGAVLVRSRVSGVRWSRGVAFFLRVGLAAVVAGALSAVLVHQFAQGPGPVPGILVPAGVVLLFALLLLALGRVLRIREAAAITEWIAARLGRAGPRPE